MGTKIAALSDVSTAAQPAATSQRRWLATRYVLVLIWVLIVAVPWVLQLQSFLKLAMSHKLRAELIPSANATMVNNTGDVLARCRIRGMRLAGAWFHGFATHYYERDDAVDGSVLCHFVVPQYNAHGMYLVENRRLEHPTSFVPSSCVNDSYPVTYYFYHGSIGYYALYSEGKGAFCSLDHTTYTSTTAIGSNDINFSTLVKFEGGSGIYNSYFFCCIGAGWLVYRAVVLSRSYRGCSRYGARLDDLGEGISVSNAVVYVQQAARLAPHSATNWHRLVLIYVLVEGLMTDLFLLIAYDGFGVKLQYISLGYNISGLLSMVFEILESNRLLRPTTELWVKRVFFNTEFTIWGELAFSAAMQYYFTALNRSKLGPSRDIAEAISYYAWSLVNHGIIVAGQAASILTIRTVGTLAYVWYRFGSLRMLTMPCCVDLVMGYRCKLTTVSGYVLRGPRLCFLEETLKAHGLLKTTDDDGKEYLVYHKIYWLPSGQDDLAIVGKLSGEHVDPWPEGLYTGAVVVCDRILGGVSGAEDWEPTGEDMDKIESMPLVSEWIEP